MAFVAAGQSFGGRVVAQADRAGWVWVWRAQAGSPPAVCVPFGTSAGALAFAQWLGAQGFRAWARRGRRCASTWEVKAMLPAGMRMASFRALVWQGEAGAGGAS